jgi:hypothetical protein
MRNLLLSLLAGILFAVCGALTGLAIGALLVKLNWLAEPGGGMVILLLIAGVAFVAGFYGFVHTKFRIEGRPSSQIREIRRSLALVCLTLGGGVFLCGAIVLMASVTIYRVHKIQILLPLFTYLILGLLCIVGVIHFGGRFWRTK